MHMFYLSTENVFTCIIIAKGIEGILSIHIGVNDDTGAVLCTVLMLRVSQDGSGHIAGPAVPEWWYICVTYFNTFRNMFGFI